MMGKSNQDVFSSTLTELAPGAPDLLIVTSDSRGSGKLGPFAQAFPDRVVEVGIAEQNLVGVAAGLVAAGKTVFAVSPACFLTARGLEQIKNDVAYSDRPVKLVGISAGVSYGALGTTHHSLHDYAALRAIHNIDIIAPADNFETRAAVLAALHHPRPVYMRFGKSSMEDLHEPGTPFAIGKAIALSTGRDVTFIATGEPVVQAVHAAELLRGRGLSCGVISMHTVKPLDVDLIRQAAEETGALVTAEDHSIIGGLGSAVAEALAGHYPAPVEFIGLNDTFAQTGLDTESLMDAVGMSVADIVAATQRVLRRKRG